MSDASQHIAVMSREILEAMHPRSGGVYIDATLGGATHTRALLDASGPDGRVMSLDLDPQAISRARHELKQFGERWLGIEANFKEIARVAEENGFTPCDGILFDLGLSSDELADPQKGLSFQVEGPLDMRLGPLANDDGLTAADIVNSWSPDEIERVIREYGEERYAYKIAKGIAEARRAARIVGTLDLAAVIQKIVPRTYERGRIHPATRTFQALRIAVNDELSVLREALEGAEQLLRPGGKLAVISFHSLEDRVVKIFVRSSTGLTAITKKPLIPSEEEQQINPRSRSAKLRIAEKKLQT